MKSLTQLFAVAALAAGHAVSAQVFYNPPDDFEGPLRAREVAYWPTNGTFTTAFALWVTEDRVYQQTQGGLIVLDRATLQSKGYLRSSMIQPVEIVGPLLFLSLSDSFLDISDPANPVPVTMPAEASPLDVYRNGRFYGIRSTPEGGRELVITDFSDPRDPKTLPGSVPVSGTNIDPYSPNELLIVNDISGDSEIADIQNPTNPKVTAQFPRAFSAARKQNILYLAHPSEIGIYDITNFEQPAHIGSISFSAGRMEIAGDALLVADQPGLSLRIYNLTNAANPVLARTLSISIPWGAFRVYGNRLYTSREVWNLENPLNPARLTSYNPFSVPAGTMGSRPGFGFAGEHAYTAVGADSYHIVDFSDPERPRRAGTFNPGMIQKIQNGLALVTGTTSNPLGSSFSIYSLTNPVAPQRILQASAPSPIAMELEGKRLYVVTAAMSPQSPEIRVYETNNTSVPTFLGSYTLDSEIGNFIVSSNVAYLYSRISPSSGEGVIDIVDLTRPEAPVSLGEVAGPDYGQQMKAIGNKLYINGGARLHAYDITDRTRLVELPAPNHGFPISIEGSRMFTREMNGIGIYDISGAGAPRFLDTIPARSFLDGLVVRGDKVVVLGFEAPLQVFQLDPLTELRDDFADKNDVGWLRWSPFAAFGAPATFTLQNGAYEISSPKSPAPHVLYTYAGSARVDLNLGDVEAQADVTRWSAGLGESTSIAVHVRTQAHPGGVVSWYSAQFTPRPTPEAQGSAISPRPNFAIVKVNRNSFQTLAIQNFENTRFSETNTYTIVMRADASRLTARLWERAGETNRLVAELLASDTDLTHGYVGVNSFDRLGLLNKGNNRSSSLSITSRPPASRNRLGSGSTRTSFTGTPG